MAAESVFTEIEITDFREDPDNDNALSVICEVRRSEHRVDIVCVYFSEDFLQRYFNIPWFKDLPKEEDRIIHKKRDLFIRWSMVKIEREMREGLQTLKIYVTFEDDAGWAEKVEQGMIEPRSESVRPDVFRLY